MDYSDGRNFNYTYDPNGNTLEKKENLGTRTVTTSDTYDIANQLVNSQEDLNVWIYLYDANGSLIEVLPESDN